MEEAGPHRMIIGNAGTNKQTPSVLHRMPSLPLLRFGLTLAFLLRYNGLSTLG